MLVAAVMLVPRLFDSDTTIRKVERDIETLTGQPVEVRGSFDFTLLPSPRFAIGNVTIGNPLAADEHWVLTIDRLELDVGFGSLITGQWDVTGSRLVRPHLTLRAIDASTGDLLAVSLTALDQLATSPARVVDGAASIQRTGGLEEIQITALNINADPRSGNQGAVILARGQVQDQGVGIDISSRLPDRNGLRRLTVTGQFGPNGNLLAFDGELDLAMQDGQFSVLAEPTIQSTRPDDLFALINQWQPGLLPWPGDLTDQPLAWQGGFAWAGHDLQFRADELKLWGGSIEGELVLGNGTMDATFEAEDLTLPENWRSLFAAWRDRLIDSAPRTGSIAMRLRNSMFGPAAINRLAVDLQLAGDGRHALDASMDLPGSGTAAMRGALAIGRNPAYVGRIEADTQNMPALMRWLGYDPDAGYVMPVSQAAIEADADWSAQAWRLDGLVARLDASRLAGSLIILPGDRITIASDLDIDRLDLDTLRQTIDARAQSLWRDELAKFKQSDVDFAAQLDARRLRLFDETMSGVSLEVNGDADQILLRTMQIEQILGGRANLTATINRQTAVSSLVLDMQIERPARLARLLNLPSPAVLASIAPLSLNAQLAGLADDFAFDLETAGTGLSIQAAGRAQGRQLAGLDLYKVGLAASRFEPLARLFALNVENRALLERNVDLAWDQATDAPSTNFALTFGDTVIDGDWQIDGAAVRRHYTIKADAHSIDPELQTELEARLSEHLGLHLPDLTPWIGRAPTTPFAPLTQLPADLDLTLTLAPDAKSEPTWQGTIKHRPDRWTLADWTVNQAFGTLQGTIDLKMKDGLLDATGSLNVSDGRLAESLASLGVESAVDGGFSGSLAFFGVGSTPENWLRSLQGEGQFAATAEIDPARGIRFVVPVVPIELVAGTIKTKPDAAPDFMLDLPAWMLETNFFSDQADADIRVFGPVYAPRVTMIPSTLDWQWDQGLGGP